MSEIKLTKCITFKFEPSSSVSVDLDRYFCLLMCNGIFGIIFSRFFTCSNGLDPLYDSFLRPRWVGKLHVLLNILGFNIFNVVQPLCIPKMLGFSVLDLCYEYLFIRLLDWCVSIISTVVLNVSANRILCWTKAASQYCQNQLFKALFVCDRLWEKLPWFWISCLVFCGTVYVRSLSQSHTRVV